MLDALTPRLQFSLKVERRLHGNSKSRAGNYEGPRIPKPGANFEIVERQIPNPGAREVRLKVQACGICHSDVLTKEGTLQQMGGAKVILATAPNSKAMSELNDGLGPNGKLMVAGEAPGPIKDTPSQLIFGTRTIQGWNTGTTADGEDTLRFAELAGERPMIETYPLERAAEAYDRIMSGNAQFRVVLTM